MKRLDKLLIYSFIAPLIATFFIALFVLVMQFLWLHIDEMLGKDLEFLILVELIFYMSVSLIPMALPIAVLIASVMVLGNLAENHELAGLNAAGISLIRILRPLIFISLLISGFSLFCSSKIMPYASLKFRTRLYDIKHQKLTLSLEEKVFNYDFNDMVIRIDKKEADNKTIRDVLIYDHSDRNNNKVSVITAKKGKMHATANRRFLIMELYDGIQYQETDKKTDFVRTAFRKWDKVFDLSEFDLRTTNPEVFRKNALALGINELQARIDSIDQKMEVRNRGIDPGFYILKENFAQAKQQKRINNSPTSRYSKNVFQQKVRTKAISVNDQFIDLFEKNDQKRLLKKSSPLIQRVFHALEDNHSYQEIKGKEQSKLVYRLHQKFSLAVVCMIFLFIGAPMGAIIRKGGFGFPLLIAILFFMLFFVSDIYARKLAENQYLPASLSAWIPCLLLLPIGLTLTYQAMTQSNWLDFSKSLLSNKKQ